MFKCLMVTAKHKLPLIGVSNNELGSSTQSSTPNLHLPRKVVLPSQI